jgi:hypothetical protein
MNRFQVGMKLEAVDKKNPHLICCATIGAVNGTTQGRGGGGVDFFFFFPLHPIAISVADPDPGSGAFLIPGSGMGRKSASGSGIRDEQPGSYFLELRNHFLVFWG